MSNYSASGAEYERNRLTVLNRDGWTCQYCGDPLEEGVNATADHLVPRSVWIREERPGNPDDTTNLIACCTSCNARRGNSLDPPRTNYRNPRWFT